MKLPWFGNRKRNAAAQSVERPTIDAGPPPPWATGERREYIPWWIWHKDAGCYRHTTSGEELHYRGQTAAPDGASPRWPCYRFDYVHTDLSYPILVEVRDFRGRHADEPALLALSGRLNPIVWKIDHDICSAMWRREQQPQSDIPPYGVWLRCEEALVGAALAWGSSGPLDARPDELALAAGWSNGLWRRDVYRRFGYSWKDASDGPFDANEPERLHRWKQFGFPRPTDFEPVALDRAAIVWHERTQVAEKEVEGLQTVAMRTRFMQGSGDRKVEEWVQVSNNDWKGDFSNGSIEQRGYLNLLSVKLPGVTGSFLYSTGLFSPNETWPSRYNAIGPAIVVHLANTKVRVESLQDFASAYGELHPGEITKSEYIGREAQGVWIGSHLDRPALARDFLCAIVDAIPTSTGFGGEDAVKPSKTFGEASELTVFGFPISGMADGVVTLRHSLEIAIDPYDDQAKASSKARAWTEFFL